MEKTKVLYVEKWPEQVSREVKARAALEGLTFREALVRAAREWAKKKPLVK